MYDNMKNALDFYRLRIHSTQAMEGKFFIGFIALILYADIQRIVYAEDKPVISALKNLFYELDKIKVVSFPNSKHLMNPLAKTQKQILLLFNIDAEKH